MLKKTRMVKGNDPLIDKYGAEITTNNSAKEIILYHGTRAPLNKILREGLLIRAGLVGKDTKLQMIDSVLQGEFALTRKQVPDWVWKFEYDYEKTIEPHLHMSINLKTAIGYARQGCEIKAQIRRNTLVWLLTRRYGDFTAKEFKELFPNADLSQIACERNGKESYVFQVILPAHFIRTEDFQFWRDLVHKVRVVANRSPMIDAYQTLKTTTLEMRCLKNIPPTRFRKVWKVHWPKGWPSGSNGSCRLEQVIIKTYPKEDFK